MTNQKALFEANSGIIIIQKPWCTATRDGSHTGNLNISLHSNKISSAMRELLTEEAECRNVNTGLCKPQQNAVTWV